jgi:hypothetical protein
MTSSFAFVVIKGASLIKIISARNQDIIMVYEAVIKVDIYGVGLANSESLHPIRNTKSTPHTLHLIFETDALFMVSLVEFDLSYNFESLGSVIFLT